MRQNSTDNSTFTGNLTHSRFYLSPEPYRGKTTLVVGSHASGADLARQISSLNLDPSQSRTKVYVSGSGPLAEKKADKPWEEYVVRVPLISSVSGRKIEFEDGTAVEDVEEILFATGYNFFYPFCKASDAPWREKPLVDGVIPPRKGAERDSDPEAGGQRGLTVTNLDELFLFLRGDRSIAFGEVCK